MEMILMSISQKSILSEIEQGKPISARTRAYYRRRLQNRIHRLILAAFREQQKQTGLNQKQLAERIDKHTSKINRWLGIPSNLTLETISDLLLGLGVDLDDPSVTPIADLVHEANQKVTNENIRFGIALNSLNNESKNNLNRNPPWAQVIAALRKQEDLSSAVGKSIVPKPGTGAARSRIAEATQQQQALDARRSWSWPIIEERRRVTPTPSYLGWE
jgi:transcriptional regulator with XRE-family HTH domain